MFHGTYLLRIRSDTFPVNYVPQVHNLRQSEASLLRIESDPCASESLKNNLQPDQMLIEA